MFAEDRDSISNAERVILPGVGAFGAAMERINELGIAKALRDRIESGKATLAICLGMQLLMTESDESTGVQGLGIATGRVERFSAAQRVPHFGWNDVNPESAGCVEPGLAYFANSYRLTSVPAGWSGAWTTYGGRFVSAMWRGACLACQFHPELSGAWGQALLQRWFDGSVPRGTPVDNASVSAGVRRRVIPCLDVRDGRVVKGVKFQNLRDAGDPAELAALYEAQGADELTVLDVSATPEGRQTAVDTVRGVRRVLSIPLTVGGGVRTIADAQRLLEAGADKVGVNSAAVRDPSLLTGLSRQFGRQCVVLALDAAEASSGDARWEVVVESGKTRTGKDAVAWAREAEERGAGEILLTSWDRDGTRRGYDLEQLAAICGAVTVPVIASGGAAGPEHLVEAVRAGADAVLAASIFHNGERTVESVKAFMASQGIIVRVGSGSQIRTETAE
jgi:imidazole glycerol-phosphate synthase subunit HisF